MLGMASVEDRMDARMAMVFGHYTVVMEMSFWQWKMGFLWRPWQLVGQRQRGVFSQKTCTGAHLDYPFNRSADEVRSDPTTASHGLKLSKSGIRAVG
ncbi:hypothetical protein ACLOJK_005901 [Asimina triloba]